MNLTLGDTQYIIDEARKRGVLRNQLAYILATAYHESAHTMKPIKETVMSHHKDKNPSDATVIQRLNNAFKKGLLGSVKNKYWVDGWFGRGYVQLTHETNYKKQGISKSQALQKEYAVKVLIEGMMRGDFTGKKLADFVTLKVSNFFDARAVVNADKNYKAPGAVKSNGNLIADIAREYDAALKVAGYGESEVVVEKVPVVADPGELEKHPAKSKTVWMSIFTALGTVAVTVGDFLGNLDWRVQLFIAAVIVGFSVYAIKRRNDLFKAVKDLKDSVE